MCSFRSSLISLDSEVKAAMWQQMEQLPFAYGGMGLVPPRCRLAALLAELAPGDLNGFLFPSSGGEANDCAIRMARLYTGELRQEIIHSWRIDLLLYV